MKYCPNCGSPLANNGSFCGKCGYKVNNTMASPQTQMNNAIQNPQYQVNNHNKLCCPRCGSPNVSVQMVTKNKETGCLTIILYLILTFTLVGIPIMILILLLKGKKTEVSKCQVCQNCGYNW